MHGNGQILSGYYSVKFTSNTSSVLHRVGSPNNENRTEGEMATRFVHDKIFICDWKYRVSDLIDKCNRQEHFMMIWRYDRSWKQGIIRFIDDLKTLFYPGGGVTPLINDLRLCVCWPNTRVLMVRSQSVPCRAVLTPSTPRDQQPR